MKIVNYEQNWAVKLANNVNLKIEEILERSQRCSVALTGGGTAKEFYLAWSKTKAFRGLRAVDFYLGDERYESGATGNSNEKNIAETLFNSGIPEGCNFYPILVDKDAKIDNLSELYRLKFPSDVDILFLTPGNDGHIASIFPGDLDVLDSIKTIDFTRKTYKGWQRITITPRVVSSARNIFLLSPSSQKLRILEYACQNQLSKLDYPVVLALEAIAIFHKGSVKKC